MRFAFPVYVIFSVSSHSFAASHASFWHGECIRGELADIETTTESLIEDFLSRSNRDLSAAQHDRYKRRWVRWNYLEKERIVQEQEALVWSNALRVHKLSDYMRESRNSRMTVLREFSRSKDVRGLDLIVKKIAENKPPTTVQMLELARVLEQTRSALAQQRTRIMNLLWQEDLNDEYENLPPMTLRMVAEHAIAGNEPSLGLQLKELNAKIEEIQNQPSTVNPDYDFEAVELDELMSRRNIPNFVKADVRRHLDFMSFITPNVDTNLQVYLEVLSAYFPRRDGSI